MKHLTLALALLAAPASAITYEYELSNFKGNLSFGAPGSYGLIYQARQHKFSFDDVTLKYDDEALTASIVGTMTQTDPRKRTGSGWQMEYFLTDLTDFGDGQFADFIGTGQGRYINPQGNVFRMGAKGMNGFFFAHLCDGHRLPNDTTSCGIHGWVDHAPDLTGANDYIASSNLRAMYGGPAPVPLPAAWAMLLGALAGLGMVRRARG